MTVSLAVFIETKIECVCIMTANTTGDDYFYVEGRVTNLIETLIEEVAATPALWNRYDNNYNRAAMDAEWARIAGLLGKESK